MDKNRNIKKLISILSLDCTTKLKNDKERKFHNGHEYVDLGLPSGTLWATMNVGTEKETGFGEYYMYGYGSKPYDMHDKPYDGYEDPLDPNADTATQVWGGKWYTPTREQFRELFTYCTKHLVSDYEGSGVKGVILESRENGNSIFLPACGYFFGTLKLYDNMEVFYQTSTHIYNDSYYIYYSIHGYNLYRCSRKFAFTVRPVLKLE